MGTDPEQLKREIEKTRQELSYDADALTEKVSPGRIVDRRVGRAKNALASARENIMGSASDSGPSRPQSRVSAAASGMADNTSDFAGTAKAQAKGNPLAAGLIAFGAGWLISALIPASEKEQQVATQLTDAVKAHAQPVKEELTQIAGELKDSLQEPAQQAVESVKATAAEGVDTVKTEGQSAAGGLKQDASAAAATVKEQSGPDAGSQTSPSPSPYGAPSPSQFD